MSLTPFYGDRAEKTPFAIKQTNIIMRHKKSSDWVSAMDLGSNCGRGNVKVKVVRAPLVTLCDLD